MKTVLRLLIPSILLSACVPGGQQGNGRGYEGVVDLPPVKESVIPALLNLPENVFDPLYACQNNAGDRGVVVTAENDALHMRFYSAKAVDGGAANFTLEIAQDVIPSSVGNSTASYTSADAHAADQMSLAVDSRKASYSDLSYAASFDLKRSTGTTVHLDERAPNYFFCRSAQQPSLVVASFTTSYTMAYLQFSGPDAQSLVDAAKQIGTQSSATAPYVAGYLACQSSAYRFGLANRDLQSFPACSIAVDTAGALRDPTTAGISKFNAILNLGPELVDEEQKAQSSYRSGNPGSLYTEGVKRFGPMGGAANRSANSRLTFTVQGYPAFELYFYYIQPASKTMGGSRSVTNNVETTSGPSGQVQCVRQNASAKKAQVGDIECTLSLDSTTLAP